VSFAMFGWSMSSTLMLKLVGSVGIPVTAMILWAVFAVPGDRSRSGSAPVPIPGGLRLALEWLFFGLGVWCLVAIDSAAMAILLGASVLIHYALSAKRLIWLLRGSSAE